MSSFKKAFESVVLTDDTAIQHKLAATLEAIAVSLEDGFNAYDHLLAVEAIAHSTTKSLTVAESKFLEYSMEGIRESFGADGNPINVKASTSGREIALESLKDWGGKAWEALKKLIAHLMSLFDQLQTRIKFSASNIKKKAQDIGNLVTKTLGINDVLTFDRGENLTLDFKSDTITTSQVEKAFSENYKNIRTYLDVIDSAHYDVRGAGPQAVKIYEKRSDKVMGIVEKDMIHPVMKEAYLGGWGMEKPDTMVESHRGPIKVKFSNIEKDLSEKSTITSGILYHVSLAGACVTKAKSSITSIQDAMEMSYQKTMHGNGSAADHEFERARIAEYRMCIRHMQNVIRLLNYHVNAANYFYNTVHSHYASNVVQSN